MKASCTPCEKSSTVSLSGQRVATMRARRSSSSASGVSIVNGRTAVLSAGVSSVTAMWVLLGGDGGLVTSRTLTVSSARRVRRRRWVCSLGSPWAAPWSRSLIAGDNTRNTPILGRLGPNESRLAVAGGAMCVAAGERTPARDVGADARGRRRLSRLDSSEDRWVGRDGVLRSVGGLLRRPRRWRRLIRVTLAQDVSRDGDVGRGDEHVTRTGGKELRHIETRRASDDRGHVRIVQQALEELGLGLVVGVGDLDQVAVAGAPGGCGHGRTPPVVLGVRVPSTIALGASRRASVSTGLLPGVVHGPGSPAASQGGAVGRAVG